MPLGQLNLITVTGRYVFLDDTKPAADSYVEFTSSTVLQEPGTPQVIFPAVLRALVSATTGAFSVALPATDDPDVTPTGFVYAVREVIVNPNGGSAGRQFNLEVPVNTPGGVLDLVTAAPAQAVTPSSTYVLTSTYNTLVARVDTLETALDTKVASTTIDTLATVTQAEYDALASPDAATLYVIVG